MKRFVAASLGLALVTFIAVPTARAAEPCPPEVAKATAALKSAQASLKKNPRAARAQQDIQAPRAEAGAKSQEIQAPRGQQDVQAPRSREVQAPRSQQDIQAPRSQDVQAPRSQEVQAPRGQQDIQAPRVNNAAALVRQAEAACKKGDMATAAQKAREATALLSK